MLKFTYHIILYLLNLQ